MNKYDNWYQYVIKSYLAILFIAIFILPMNFFLVWRTPGSYWMGHFIDTWAPKLYVSQLLILLCVALLLFLRGLTTNWRPRRMLQIRLFQFLATHWKVILLLLTLLIQQFFTARPEASFVWFMGVLLGGAPLFWLLRQEETKPQGVWWAVFVGTVFQAGLGLLQYLSNGTVVGYWFFGEPNLTGNAFLAWSSWSKTVQILPYGTTPHPNILASWLLVGLWASWRISRNNPIYKGILLAGTGVLVTTLLLTESWSAWLSGLVLLFYVLFQGKWDTWYEKTHQKLSGKLQLLGILLAYILFWTTLVWYVGTQTNFGKTHEAWSRRARLLEAGARALPSTIFHGVGWNQQITIYSPQEVSLVQAGFWQPIHNVVLSLVIENGFCILLLLCVLFIFDHKKYSFANLYFLLFLPSFYLDHFFFSNLSGQYLLLLLLYFSKNKKD